VTCDLVLIGGITVLSGPLGIYGEQGLQGGQAWLSYYNSIYAPSHHLRKSKLIYYDDHGADPSQDATLTQRLVEQDHVFSIAGMPAPQGADPYLRQHKIPLIGDLGLNPISFQSPMIWPTAPNTATNAKVSASVISGKFHGLKKIGVILSPLPGEDPSPIEKAETDAYAHYGATVKFEVMTTNENDCNSHLLQIQNFGPDFLELPVVSTPFLLCIQAAQSQGFYPGGSSPRAAAIKGWQGGSGIGVEMDQCGSLCNGMYSHGTLFYDPKIYSNHDPNNGMDLYNANMAKYASNVDKTSIISENYYVAGMINSKLNEQASTSPGGLTRDHIIALANKFHLDTGMGLIIDWGGGGNTTNAHSGTSCGFPQVAGPPPGGGKTQWNTVPNKVCA
jgi:ABC-type branched-subunit amino acid transport system substrate-binding protein